MSNTVLEAGIFPGAILSLASIAIVYSFWVAIAVLIGSILIVYAFVLLCETIAGKVNQSKGPTL
jgi:hypothetical protein